MKILKCRLELYRFISQNKWSSNPIVISFPFDVDEDEGIETRKDTFQFKILNHRLIGENYYDNYLGLSNSSSNVFRINDKLLIYAWYGSTPSNLNSALIIDGIITELNESGGQEGNIITISGANSTEEMLSTMVPSSYEKATGQFNTPEVIIEIIKKVNSFNRGKKIAAWLNTEKRRWDSAFQDFVVDNTNGVYGSIQGSKSDGTNFSDITYAENWKSAYQQVETLSTFEYTGDSNGGVYVFGFKPFVDPVTGDRFNQFFWTSKKTSLSGSITEGVDIYPLKVSRGTWDVYNAAIVNAGQDLYNAGILRVVYNPASMGKIGAKWKYIPLTNKFDRLYDGEKRRGTELGSTFGTDRFPDTYPWVFPFEYMDPAGKILQTTGSAANDSDFNTILRNKAGDMARVEAKAIVDQFGEARYKAEGELNLGSNNYILGDLYSIISPSFGWKGDSTNPSKKLRLVDARHIFNSNGWNTTLFYEEDEKTISDRVN